jgi:hypothetical protein
MALFFSLTIANKLIKIVNTLSVTQTYLDSWDIRYIFASKKENYSEKDIGIADSLKVAILLILSAKLVVGFTFCKHKSVKISARENVDIKISFGCNVKAGYIVAPVYGCEASRQPKESHLLLRKNVPAKGRYAIFN